MNIDTLAGAGPNTTGSKITPSDAVDIQRKTNKEQASEPQASTSEAKVQPEELLDTIKSITQDGLYSVRFEQFKDSNELVVKIMDNETNEVIRQLPPDELIELKLTFEELRGNLVKTAA